MVVVIVLMGALVTVENAVWLVVVVKVVGVWAILIARWKLELSKKVKVMCRIGQQGLTIAGCCDDKSLDIDLANYDYELAILLFMTDSEHHVPQETLDGNPARRSMAGTPCGWLRTALSSRLAFATLSIPTVIVADAVAVDCPAVWVRVAVLV